MLVTRAGIEPALPPWKGGVLTAWPTGHISQKIRISNWLILIFCVAPPAGLEPATSWLTVMRSANWAIEEYLFSFR
jgi:hypothetical protein